MVKVPLQREKQTVTTSVQYRASRAVETGHTWQGFPSHPVEQLGGETFILQFNAPAHNPPDFLDGPGSSIWQETGLPSQT